MSTWNKHGQPSPQLWLAGCSEAGVLDWVQRHLRALPARVATALSFPRCGIDSYIATSLCLAICDAAAPALELLQLPLVLLTSTGDWPQLRKLCAPLLEASFLAAQSQAAAAMSDLAQHTIKQAPSPGLGYNNDDLISSCFKGCACTAGCAVVSIYVISSLLLQHHIGTQANAESPEARPEPAKLPDLVTQLAAALQSSQVLAGASKALLTFPGPDGCLLPGQARRPRVTIERPAAAGAVPMCDKAFDSDLGTLLHALTVLPHAAALLHSAGQGQPEAERAHQAVCEALSHADVAALRLAALETLWEQAGMEPAGDAAEGRSGSSSGAPGGSASAARMTEAQQQALWRHHAKIVSATLGLWVKARAGEVVFPEERCLPPERGVPSGLQMARVSARTAEALCRLSRGEGLGGACPNPLVPSHAVCMALLGHACTRNPGWSPAEAAHWLEAGAMVLAMAGEGLAASMDAVQRPQPGPCDVPPPHLVEVMSAAVGRLSQASRCLAQDWCRTGAGREGVLARLRWARLGAGLDRVLRLAYLAALQASSPAASESDRALAGFLEWVPMTAFTVCTALDLAPLAPADPEAREALGESGAISLTYAKRALGLALALENQGRELDTAQCRTGPPTLSVQQEARRTLSALQLLALRQREQRRELAAAGRAGPLAAEADAYALQAVCRLAARVISDSAQVPAGDRPAAPDPLAPVPSRADLSFFLNTCLLYMTDDAQAPADRTAEAQILARQPHRLLAAGCQLLCSDPDAGPGGGRSGAAAAAEGQQLDAAGRIKVAGMLVRSLTALAAHPLLTARVQRWLLQSPASGGGSGARGRTTAAGAGAPGGAGAAEPAGSLRDAATAGAEKEAEAEAERGCLAQAWLGAMRFLALVPDGGLSAGMGLRLLQAANGQAASESFRCLAQTFLPFTNGHFEDMPRIAVLMDATRVLLGSPADARRDAQAVLAAALPPPLAPSPEAGIWIRLRVCGRPGCCNFGAPCEAELKLKLCGGCRAVRYCGRDCQAAAWREGHKERCKAMAAAVQAAAVQAAAAQAAAAGT